MSECMRCEIMQEMLEKQCKRYEAWYDEVLPGYDEIKLVNDANWVRGLVWASSQAAAKSVLVENKMLQLALNQIHCKDCDTIHPPG